VTLHIMVHGVQDFEGFGIFLVVLRKPKKDLTQHSQSPGLDLPNTKQEHYSLDRSVWCVQVRETGMRVQNGSI
jgi:hypothetical protein